MGRRAEVIAMCLTGLIFGACSPATQAALIPQLDLGLRSVRSTAGHASLPAQRAKQRWDLTVFARLAWTSRSSATLIPSRQELSPDAWIDACPDQDCFWDNPDTDTDAPTDASGAQP